MNSRKIRQFIFNFLFIALFLNIVYEVVILIDEHNQPESGPEYIESILMPGTEQQIVESKNDGLRKALVIPKVKRLIESYIVNPSDSIKIKEFLLEKRDSLSLKNDTYICTAYTKTPQMGGDTTFYRFRVETRMVVTPDKNNLNSPIGFHKVKMEVVSFSDIAF